MKIKTVGDFRRVTENLSDDFKLDVIVMEEVPEEELRNRLYKYPWDMFTAELEFQDIGYSDKQLCIGVYKKV